MAAGALAAEPGVSASAGLLRPGPPPLERFVRPLSLTPEQQVKLRPIFEQAQQQAAEDVKEASSDGKKPNPAQLAATLQMHDADFRMRLSNVLTPAQLTKYEQMTVDRTSHGESGEMHGAHGHREVDTPASAAER